MAYIYDDFLNPLNEAKERLSNLGARQRKKLSTNNMEALEKILPILKNYIKQTEQDDILDDILAGITNINTHIENGAIGEADNEIALTLGLLKEKINRLPFFERTVEVVEKMKDKIREADNTVTAIHKRQEEIEKIISEIETTEENRANLLAGETSAALAKIFKERKDQLRNRALIWATSFAAGLVSFIGAGIYFIIFLDGLDLEEGSDLNDFNLLIAVILRLVFFVPALWVIIVSSKKLTEVLRLEEGYAHKEAFLTLFVGYRREISNIDERKEFEGFDKTPYLAKFIDKVIGISAKDFDYVFKHESIDERKENNEEQIDKSEKTPSNEVSPNRLDDEIPF